jgi:deoxyguanosine kinase
VSLYGSLLSPELNFHPARLKSENFFAPFFSSAYAFLFGQLLSFHNDTKYPGVTPPPRVSSFAFRVSTLSSRHSSLAICHCPFALFSAVCGLFAPVAKFKPRIFNRMRTLSRKLPGWVNNWTIKVSHPRRSAQSAAPFALPVSILEFGASLPAFRQASLSPSAIIPHPMAHESSSAKRAPVPQRGPLAPRFIVVEGPLRVGKSTLAKVLAERLHARRVFDCEDNPFLAEFYKEKPGSAFRAQMYFLMERQCRLREAIAVEAPGPVISDYLMEKDRIFANLNLNDEELKLYDRYYETLASDLPAPDLVIYLQAKPEVLRARIAKKAARDETQISLEYIEEVARAYEHFFFRYAASDLLVINTSEIDFVERSTDLQQLLRRLQDPVKGTQYFLPLGASE